MFRIDTLYPQKQRDWYFGAYEDFHSFPGICRFVFRPNTVDTEVETRVAELVRRLIPTCHSDPYTVQEI